MRLWRTRCDAVSSGSWATLISSIEVGDKAEARSYWIAVWIFYERRTLLRKSKVKILLCMFIDVDALEYGQLTNAVERTI